ncbi:DMT family protein [Arcicella rigui]|uniref:DMT family protein n=1 Tax=Arcicella rigui TaxID=797020 RepID=A0ABU5Q3Z1_9BACT|nr:DMT family protein [Arcicella rigui]MEA5137546.1 DMT family protein [Arcicella rigui]
MKTIYTISLLILSNVFMTLAWYGHLQFKNITSLKNLGFFAVILISWGLAFFEYIFQVPANKIGYKGNGGPFSMFELKTIQEAISLIVFAFMTTFVFRTEKMGWNHLVGFGLIVLAVYVIFRKW